MTTRASDIKLESDEGGWFLTIEDVNGERHDFDIHWASEQLLAEVTTKLLPYWAEARAARADMPYDQEDAYDLSSPKHPRHHEVYSDLADTYSMKVRDD